MKMQRLGRTRTVAVIGSIAAIGGSASAIAATSHRSSQVTTGRTSMSPAGPGGRKPLASLSTAELAALAKARAAIAAAAAAIATPILDKAVAAGTITAEQRTEVLASLNASQGPGSGPDGIWTGATGATGWSGSTTTTGSSGSTTHAPPSAAAQAVFDSARGAVQAKVNSIATPVLDAAVTAGTLSSTQESILLGLLANGPLTRHGGPGGPGGPGKNMPAPPTAG
jgi:hypothetical protein